MPWRVWTGPGLLRGIGWAGGRCPVPAILRESLRVGGPTPHNVQPRPNPGPSPPDKSEATLTIAQQLPPRAPALSTPLLATPRSMSHPQTPPTSDHIFGSPRSPNSASARVPPYTLPPPPSPSFFPAPSPQCLLLQPPHLGSFLPNVWSCLIYSQIYTEHPPCVRPHLGAEDSAVSKQTRCLHLRA